MRHPKPSQTKKKHIHIHIVTSVRCKKPIGFPLLHFSRSTFLTFHSAARSEKRKQWHLQRKPMISNGKAKHSDHSKFRRVGQAKVGIHEVFSLDEDRHE